MSEAPEITAVETVLGTTCAVVNETSIYCWGRNSAGQVGNGDSGDDKEVSTPALLNLPA